MGDQVRLMLTDSQKELFTTSNIMYTDKYVYMFFPYALRQELNANNNEFEPIEIGQIPKDVLDIYLKNRYNGEN